MCVYIYQSFHKPKTALKNKVSFKRGREGRERDRERENESMSWLWSQTAQLWAASKMSLRTAGATDSTQCPESRFGAKQLLLLGLLMMEVLRLFHWLLKCNSLYLHVSTNILKLSLFQTVKLNPKNICSMFWSFRVCCLWGYKGAQRILHLAVNNFKKTTIL